jgi:ABC-type uncharacterized transport system substrate-binding protein
VQQATAETTSRDLQAAARTLGLQLHVLHASTERDFDAVFANLLQLRAGGLVISGGQFFISRSEQLAALAAHYAVPAIHETREFVTAGGLMSYGGNNFTDAVGSALTLSSMPPSHTRFSALWTTARCGSYSP